MRERGRLRKAIAFATFGTAYDVAREQPSAYRLLLALLQLRGSLRLVILTGVCALALGLINPTKSRANDLASEQQAWRESATASNVTAGKPAADDTFSYLLTPFKLASQPISSNRFSASRAGRIPAISVTPFYSGTAHRNESSTITTSSARPISVISSSSTADCCSAPKSDSLIDSAITVLAATPSFIRTAWSSRRSSGPEPHFERMVLRCLIRSGFRQVLCLD